MEHVKDLLSAASAPQKERAEPSRTDEETNALDNLWVRMAAIYGDLWARKYGEQPDGMTGKAWGEVIRKLGGRRVAIGIKCCLSDPGEFPPTPGKFRKWAEDNDHPAYAPQQVQGIEEKPAEDHVREHHLNQLKSMFGGKDV